MVIAPVFGFDDYKDYYRKTQSGQFLKGIRVPFLAVQVCVFDRAGLGLVALMMIEAVTNRPNQLFSPQRCQGAMLGRVGGSGWVGFGSVRLMTT